MGSPIVYPLQIHSPLPYASLRAALSSFLRSQTWPQTSRESSKPKIVLHRLDIVPILKGEDSERVLQ